MTPLGAFLVFLLLAIQADWSSVWRDLAALRDPATPPARVVELRAALASRAQRALAADVASPERTRGALLAAQLASASGEDTRESLRRLARAPLRGLEVDELWDVVATLDAGPARVRAVLAALAATETPSAERARLAWSVGVEEARALRLATGALPVQRVLEQRYHALWSTIDLALTLSRLGRTAELDALMEAAIAREAKAGRDTAELWARWGIAAYGLGLDSAARDRLGRALAQGSQDAALVLARMDLRAGRLEAVRSGLRTPILSDPPASWALRAWGLALLAPDPAERPLRSPGDSPVTQKKP